MMNSKTTIVTVTYGNRLDYLEQLVERSLAYPQIDHVIVVSNASTAPLETLTQRWPTGVTIIRLDANTGSANGYAVAIEAALKTDAQYLWMMDDDNAPTPSAIEHLYAQLAQRGAHHGLDKVAVLGFRPTQQADIASGVPHRYATQLPSSYFGFHVMQLPYKLWRRMPWGKPKGKPEPLVSVPFAPYGGMLAHRSLYERIGLPLRELVLYVDDTEYTRRITAMGGHLYVVTDALIEELEHSWNIKERTSNIYETFLLGGSDFRAYYTARNQAWFDKNVWAASPLMYRINRGVFHYLLAHFARKSNTASRFEMIRSAITEGETGALGINKSFPL